VKVYDTVTFVFFANRLGYIEGRQQTEDETSDVTMKMAIVLGRAPENKIMYRYRITRTTHRVVGLKKRFFFSKTKFEYILLKIKT